MFNPFFWLIFSIFRFVLMPNYGLFTNFVFLQVLIQKGENFSKKEEKRAIAELCVSRQTSKQMAKEIGHENISSIATQRTEYRRRAMSRQKIVCHDRT